MPLRYARAMTAMRRPAGDRELVQIVDAALADAGRRAGDWLACRPGCTQCCVGVFEISPLDAARLLDGLATLRKLDPTRGTNCARARGGGRVRLSPDFPGNAKTGVLGTSAEEERRFEGFANDEPCPVLDPETGLCELYESRPMTCRTFGRRCGRRMVWRFANCALRSVRRRDCCVRDGCGSG